MNMTVEQLKVLLSAFDIDFDETYMSNDELVTLETMALRCTFILGIMENYAMYASLPFKGKRELKILEYLKEELM